MGKSPGEKLRERRGEIVEKLRERQRAFEGSDAARAEHDAIVADLHAIFPGENVPARFVTAAGIVERLVHVREWGAEEATTIIPRQIGSIFAKLSGDVLAKAAVSRGASAADVSGIVNAALKDALPAAIAEIGGDIAHLVARCCNLDPVEMRTLLATDFVELARAVVRVNASFFVKTLALVQDVKGTDAAQLRGATSSSGAQDSHTTS